LGDVACTVMLASGTIATYVMDYMTTFATVTPAWYRMAAVGIGFAAMIAMRETAPVKTPAAPEYGTA
jgi:hypothetical protein